MSLVLLSCARLLGGAVWHFERKKKDRKTQHCWRSIYSCLNIGIKIIASEQQERTTPNIMKHIASLLLYKMDSLTGWVEYLE